MQLKAALEFAMEAPQLVVYHHKLWKYAASSGVPPDDAAIVQQVVPPAGHMLQVYHLQHIVMSSRSTTCCYAAILFVDRKRCTTFCLCELKLAKENEVILCCVLWVVITNAGLQTFYCNILMFKQTDMT